MNNKEIKRVSKRKRKVTKLVMKITSTPKRWYHCKVVPSPTTAPFDSSLAAAVATTPFDSRFDPRQWRHLIHAHLVSQLQKLSQRGAWGCELVLQQSANFAEAAKSRRPLFLLCFGSDFAPKDFLQFFFNSSWFWSSKNLYYIKTN